MEFLPSDQNNSTLSCDINVDDDDESEDDDDFSDEEDDSDWDEVDASDIRDDDIPEELLVSAGLSEFTLCAKRNMSW